MKSLGPTWGLQIAGVGFVTGAGAGAVADMGGAAAARMDCSMVHQTCGALGSAQILGLGWRQLG